MPNDIVVTKNTTSGSERWDVTYTADQSATVTKTMLTAGDLLDRNIRIAITTPSGSATTPATTITPNDITISVNSSTGLITASNTQKTQNVTPTVSAGYISSGTAGTITVSAKSATSQLSTQAGATISPTESEQTAVAANKYTLGAVKVGAISSTYVGSGITQRDSDDLSVSGATVTAPAGYYASNASASVASMTLPTSASSTSSGTSKATISRSTSDQYINIPTGYNGTASYYKVSATPNGSATGPSSLSASNATVTAGTNTITLTKTGVSTTPTVSAGYVSSATSSTATVALTASVTTKGATTYLPDDNDQTIASDTYLTGVQTIKGVETENFSAENIKYNTQVSIGYYNDYLDMFDPTVGFVTGTFTGASTVSSGQTAATASQILSGYSAWVNGAEVQGSVTSKSAQTYTPTTSNQTISSGQYLSGTQTILGDANLVAGNIKDGVSIFNVTGTYAGGTAVLQDKTATPKIIEQTISADIGYDGLDEVTVEATQQAPTYIKLVPSQSIASGGYIGNALVNNWWITYQNNTLRILIDNEEYFLTPDYNVYPSGSQYLTGSPSWHCVKASIAFDDVDWGYITFVDGNTHTIQIDAIEKFIAITRSQDVTTTNNSNGICGQLSYLPSESHSWWYSTGYPNYLYVIIYENGVNYTYALPQTTLDGYYAWGEKDGNENPSFTNYPVLIAEGPENDLWVYTATAKTINILTAELLPIKGKVSAPASIQGSGAQIGYPDSMDAIILSKTISVTPTVITPGYIDTGTAGNSSVSLSAPVNVLAATTYNRSTSVQTIPAGTYLAGAQTIAATPNGSVTAPSSISGTAATVSTGTNTLTLTKSISVTPNVTTAGYISSGTAGTSSVSLTADINTRNSSDLTVDGATITAPAGYYASSASASITTMTLPTAVSSSSSGSRKAYINTTTATRYINIPVGYNSTAAYYQIRPVTTANITAENIKTGVTVTVGDGNSATRIKNVTGSFTSSSTVSSGQTAASANEIISGYSAWVNGVEVQGKIVYAVGGKF